MEYELLGWPPDGPQLSLDHERFAYAGKFVMTTTGKAVALEEGDPVAAVAFNADRTDERTLWLRYVTVRDDRRGEGIGPRLCGVATARALDRGFDRVRIAVNNPFAYEALYKAGFGYADETTGIAELVLERPGDRSRARYQTGLDRFRARDLSPGERDFLADREGAAPPTAAKY